MTDVTDLVTWLRAQLDDDEQVWTPYLTGPVQTGNPVDRRMLAEVDAKRRIIRDIAIVVLSPGRETCPPEWVAQLERFLRLLALPYADRDGYREEWRP